MMTKRSREVVLHQNLADHEEVEETLACPWRTLTRATLCFLWDSWDDFSGHYFAGRCDNSRSHRWCRMRGLGTRNPYRRVEVGTDRGGKRKRGSRKCNSSVDREAANGSIEFVTARSGRCSSNRHGLHIPSALMRPTVHLTYIPSPLPPDNRFVLTVRQDVIRKEKGGHCLTREWQFSRSGDTGRMYLLRLVPSKYLQGMFGLTDLSDITYRRSSVLCV
ncbi:hypothetical protein J6590_034235 [Homalodisca vitripennis]|nr:hypothetical protein J6590_034235 [Homalodisca vitripennis]